MSSLLLTPHLLAADPAAELKIQLDRLDAGMASRDAKLVESVLADSFLLITRTGMMNTKSELLERLAAGRTPQRGASPESVKTTMHGNTAIVIRNLEQKSETGIIPIIASEVWVKGPNGWKCAFIQVTIRA